MQEHATLVLRITSEREGWKAEEGRSILLCVVCIEA